MSVENNLVSVTVSKLVSDLSELYSEAYKVGMLSDMPAACLWGPMGVGKSSGVYAMAENIQTFTNVKTNVIDIRLLNFSPIDLRGVPVPDPEKQFTVWLKPKIFEMKEEEITILFLDEISSAPPSMQAAAYQIALDKRIGEFRLPENCIVMLAGNRTIDKAVVYQMPKPLANRLLHFEVVSAFDSWYRWALQNKLDMRVIGYLSFDHSKLNQSSVGVEELAFTTPRSWEMVSKVLKGMNHKEPKALHSLISGCIGVSNAIEFEAWCDVYKQLPSLKDIFYGKALKPVKKADVLYALSTSLLVYTMEHQNDMPVEQMENLCNYVTLFPDDYAVLFFQQLREIEGMKLQLTKIDSFKKWMKTHKRYL